MAALVAIGIAAVVTRMKILWPHLSRVQGPSSSTPANCSTKYFLGLTRAALLYVRQVIRTSSASTVLITLPQLGLWKVKPVWLYARFTGTVQVAMRDRQ